MTAPISQLRRGQERQTGPDSDSSPLIGLLGLLPKQYWWSYKSEFTYGTSFQPLAASTTSTSNIVIDGNTDFIVTFGMCEVRSSDNATLLSFWPQLVRLYDGAAQSQLMNAQLPASHVYGGSLDTPGIFAMPYIFTRSTTLTVEHQNQEATARNVWASFAGFKSVPGSDTRKAEWQRP